jgi:hypothetical protein
MASRFRCTPFVRLAVGAAALAIPLFAASSAVAAMGGAIPLTSTNRPDLRTVTLIGSNAQFCFDKTLSQGGGPLSAHLANFVLGGYNPGGGYSTSATAATYPITLAYDLSNTSCVDAVYPSSNGPPANATIDYNQYTYGSVGQGAVTSLSGGAPNAADSTTLTGSTTNNGTTGNTVAPDLTGVAVDKSLNVVTFVFNKNIGNVPDATRFSIVDTGGNTCAGNVGTASASGNSVTVGFPAACGAPYASGNAVGNAVRAVVAPSTVKNATAFGELNNDTEVAIVPLTSGTTAKPDLVSAMLEPSGSAIDYNFDQPITTAPNLIGTPPVAHTPIPGDFKVDLANNSIASGVSETITNTATTGTVRVTFTSGANFNEYDVKATVLVGGATGLNGGNPSTGGSVPVGDNAGAFARGFTSGPDAVAATFASATGDATVTFDQRVFGDGVNPNVPTGFVLLDQSGTPISGGTGTNINFVPAAAGPMQVTVHFNPTAISLAKAIEICGPPDAVVAAKPAECTTGLVDASTGSVFTSGLSPAGNAPNEPNVQQILSPFAVSAKLIKRVTVFKPKAAAHAKKHAKKHAKVRKHRSHKR